MDGMHFETATVPARLPLAGKTALVTGSTSGIGLGIAKALAGAGVNIVMSGFGEVDAALAAVRAVRRDAQVDYHGANLAHPPEIEGMVAQATGRFGAVDILVNNAGLQHVAPVDVFPVDRWDLVLAVNLTAAFHTTRLLLPSMKARGFGRIVNVASVHGLVGSAEKSAYVAAKHGLLGLTKVVALETARTNVTCNAICPGWVRTPLVERQIEARAAQRGVDLVGAADALVSEKQPSGDFVSVDELAQLVLFLASDAARQVRGAAWTIDGGWTAQ